MGIKLLKEKAFDLALTFESIPKSNLLLLIKHLTNSQADVRDRESGQTKREIKQKQNAMTL